MKSIKVASALAACSSLLLQAASPPQGIQRIEVQRGDLVVPGREAVQARVELDEGMAFEMHRHPGDEMTYVLEGTLEYEVEGRPPVTLSAGDSLFIPSGVPHSARNVGAGKAVELATYIVEIGKPLVVMAR